MGSLKIETSNDYGFSMTAKRTHEYLRDRLGAQQSDSQNGFLKTVRERKLELVRAAKARRPFSAVVEDATLAAPPRGFLANLAFHRERGNYGLIAEIKRASPGIGLIRNDFHPASLARACADGGAACLSVVTDAAFFNGADDHLAAARAAVDLPVMRKDYLVDPYQIAESRALGADCVTLILGMLDDSLARDLEALAIAHHMDVIIVVQNEAEVERSTAFQSTLIGIANRDHNTLKINRNLTPRLARLLPRDRIVVSQGGFDKPEQLADMAGHGVRCFLIGGALMRQADVEAATNAILAPPRRFRASG